MVSNRIIKIDLNKKTKNVVQMVQGDTNRKLTINVYDSDEPYLVNGVGGKTIHGAVYIEKPDGTTCGYDSLEDDSPAVTGSGNTLTVYFVPQATTAHGWAYMTVSIFDDEGVELNTFGIDLFIDKKATATISADYWNLRSIEGLTAAVEGLTQQMVRSVNHATADSNGNVTLLPWQLQYSNVIGGQQVGDVEEALDALARGSSGLTAEIKSALLNCFAHVAWIDEHGQDYYDALDNALNPPADLLSIAAVFNQGTTVIYDTDSLDDLKQYLTVTANYSDGTSETVTSYTLSGTLTVGTSTIIVSYGGKTTTFTVTVTQAVEPEYVIPSEYQEVEWVGKDTEYTGTDNTGPFIRTNITEASKQDLNGYTVDITASVNPSYSANPAPILAFSSKAGCYFGAANNGSMGMGGSSFLPSSVISTDRNTYQLSWSASEGSVVCGEESTTRAYTTTGADAQQLVIGNGSVFQSYTKEYKIYGAVVVKKNDVLVGRFVPCYRKSDSVIGFYDTVREQFYTNSGSSDARVAFVKGADV